MFQGLISCPPGKTMNNSEFLLRKFSMSLDRVSFYIQKPYQSLPDRPAKVKIILNNTTNLGIGNGGLSNWYMDTKLNILSYVMPT